MAKGAKACQDSHETEREAAEQYLAGARAGSIAGRGGTRYRPSVIRGYRQVMNLHVLPDVGGRPLAEHLWRASSSCDGA